MTAAHDQTNRMHRVLETWPCGCRIEEPSDLTQYAERLVICPQHANGRIARPKWREIVFAASSVSATTETPNESEVGQALSGEHDASTAEAHDGLG